MVADAGIESWATREAAKGKDIPSIATKIVPLRLTLAAAVFLVLILSIPLFPDYGGLSTLLTVFGLGCFTQALNLKWVFLGRQQMTAVSKGLVLMQLIFAILVFFLARTPDQFLWVPLYRIAGELLMVLYFWFLYRKSYGGFSWKFSIEHSREILRASVILGASLLLGLMSYNFDSVLLGFMIGPHAVGLYNAAYKPVTVALAMPVTYFIGLFPALSRAHEHSEEAFRAVVNRSFQLTAFFAVPVAVGGSFLAAPIMKFLFGEAYADSIPVLQVLIWSAALAVLRGTFKHGLVAAGKQNLDLRCAFSSALVNVVLNIAFIPVFGAVGAASATVIAELLWLLLSSHYFHRNVTSARLLPHMVQPLLAGIVMTAFLFATDSIHWIVRGSGATIIYVGLLYLLHHSRGLQQKFGN